MLRGDVGEGHRTALRSGLGYCESGKPITGASIADLKGRLDATFRRDAEGPPQYRLTVDADRFRIGGIALGAGRALILNGPTSGDVRKSRDRPAPPPDV